MGIFALVIYYVARFTAVPKEEATRNVAAGGLEVMAHVLFGPKAAHRLAGPVPPWLTA